MKKNIKYMRQKRINQIKLMFWIIVLNILFIPQYTGIISEGDNYFQVVLDGISIGYVVDTELVDDMIIEARAKIAQESDELVFLTDFDLEMIGEEVLVGEVSDPDEMADAMSEILSDHVMETLQRSYTVKINDYAVNLESSEAVIQLIQAAIDKYDTEGHYSAELVLDATRELTVLTAQVVDNVGDDTGSQNTLLQVGVESYFANMLEGLDSVMEKDFDEYDYGLKDLGMGDEIEVVESYLMVEEITDVAVAIEDVTKDQEVQVIYEVASGDTLSEISLKLDIPLDTIFEMNENIENEYSTIRIGDEIIVTEPEPELSIEREELVYYEETYDADIEYVYNDEWYTTDQVTLQNPSAGFRNVAVTVSYRNEKEISRVIEKEEIIVEAVPKIVEIGTQIPPTVIKPISGGTISSGFGYRVSPTAGASTYHGGVDWAVPTGTSVSAASGGVVIKAGWVSGYGYAVYIEHPNGMETRYAHLSKVLVSVGQTVSQGQKIALSGNTGVSTGPHLHFEVIVNGTKMNPLNYIQ